MTQMKKRDETVTDEVETVDIVTPDEPCVETQAQDLPEQITLTREEFNEVKAHINALQKEKDDLVMVLQRLQADFDNYRRRNAALHAESFHEGERALIKSLLPALDSFERALENAESVDATWLEGIKLVQRQFVETLAKSGLEEIPADGKFDPTLHEAMMQEEAMEAESGDILEVFQKGYRVKNRIIRHSMVKVAK